MKYIISTLIALFILGCGGANDSNSTLLQATSQSQHQNPFATHYVPQPGTSWQWQLNGQLNTAYEVDLYDVDLFDTNISTIKSLHERGKKVICYFSAGSYENWREDKDLFFVETLGNDLDGWEGEKWLDISAESLRPIMANRLQLAKEKGCDGVEPDNIDGYTNNTGFALSATDQLEYNRFLADEAHARGLGIGLKNDLLQVSALEPYFDFAINERCHEYAECDLLAPFVQKGKAVFNVEYNSAYVDNTTNQRDLMCAASNQLGLQTLILPLNLDDTFRISCD